MPTQNARKHVIPSGGDQSITRATIFTEFGNSIRDIVPVATVTERTQLVSTLTNAGQGPSSTKPLVVLRADAPGLHRLEYTTNGTIWVPASGVLQFASEATATSWATSNSGLLVAGDRALIAGLPYEWSGAAWRSRNRTAVFTIAIGGFGDATLAGSAIPTTPKADETTDASFITARTGTSCTVTAGLYLATIYFEVSGQTFSGRTFAEVSVGSTVVNRNNSQHGVSENGVGVTALCQVMTDGTVIGARIFKTTGANSTVGGRLTVTKLA